MAKNKLGPLAAALVAVDALSPEETATLVDYLRGKQPKTPRKRKAQGEKDKGPTRLPDNPDNFLKDQKVG